MTHLLLKTSASVLFWGIIRGSQTNMTEETQEVAEHWAGVLCIQKQVVKTERPASSSVSSA